jgi:hypothetical protein
MELKRRISFILKRTRRETVVLGFKSKVKFDGIRISAVPTCCWIVLLKRDFIEIVSTNINASGVFIVKFCPIFK